MAAIDPAALYSRVIVLLRTVPDLYAIPEFQPKDSLVISEATELGTILTTFEARAGSSSITYSIEHGIFSSYFELDPYSGELMLVRPLDYESFQALTLTIMAKTMTSNNTQTIRIQILDENDNDPVILNDVFKIQVF